MSIFARSLGNQLDRILECRPELIDSAIKDFAEANPEAEQVVHDWVSANQDRLRATRQRDLAPA